MGMTPDEDTPLHRFTRKQNRVRQAMQDLGFTDEQIRQIMIGLLPSNVDDVIAVLERYEHGDLEDT